MEKLPQTNFQMEYPKLKEPSFWQKNKILFLLFLTLFLGFILGQISNVSLPKRENPILSPTPTPSPSSYTPQSLQEEMVIKVVKEASPAVVSIIITKDVPKLKLYYQNPFEGFEEFFGPFRIQIPQFKQEGYEKRQIGGGTGFFISKDGLLLTNAHVVSDENAEYTVLTNDGKQYSAKVLGKDRFRDIAIIKVEGNNFPILKLGDSDNLQIGQTVIAIGNALGEFRNTVSVGVISGLGRRVTAGDGEIFETIEDVIQTDAAINRGNSGGPLLNLKGEVIGINFAMAQQAENIGFAIPINKAKKDIEQIKTKGKISYPFLGVRYVLVTKEIKEEKNLPVDYGALIIRGERGEDPIFKNSPAEKIGLKEGDIILEFNGEKITKENSLAKIISKYNPGDKVSLKVQRKEKILYFQAILGESPLQ
jgi:serine protease Do